jgi:hypothetical protein
MKRLALFFCAVAIIIVPACGRIDNHVAVQSDQEPSPSVLESTIPQNESHPMLNTTATPNPSNNDESSATTYNSYYDAVNLYKVKNTLDISATGKYTFNGLSFSGVLDEETLYLAMAKALEGFDLAIATGTYGNWGRHVSKLVFGISKPKDSDKLKPLVKNAQEFIARDVYAVDRFLKRLSVSEYVSGVFQFDIGKYDFSILNYYALSKELGITETALGYTLAMLEVYGASATISQDEYSCNLKITRRNIS